MQSLVPMSVHTPLGQVGADIHALPPEHSVSHWQEAAQSMPIAQVALAVQFTRQGPVPQTIGKAQASVAAQVMRQSLAALQSMPPPHEFRPPQSTRHFTPGGQTTSAAQESDSAQSITQVSASQREQLSGQTKLESGSGGASGAFGSASMIEEPPSPDSMHQPPEQTRPPLQSAWLSQL